MGLTGLLGWCVVIRGTVRESAGGAWREMMKSIIEILIGGELSIRLGDYY